jgi:hypothetical protein
LPTVKLIKNIFYFLKKFDFNLLLFVAANLSELGLDGVGLPIIASLKNLIGIPLILLVIGLLTSIVCFIGDISGFIL